MCWVPHVTRHMSLVTCHLSHVECRVSHVLCHLSHVTNANSHSNGPSPLLTPQLCTAGWFAKTNKSTFSRGAILDHFCAKIANFETTVLA